MPKLSANALNVPPYNGLVALESRTAQEGVRNLRVMVERHVHAAGPEAHAEPPRRSTPRTTAMVVLESGHY